MKIAHILSIIGFTLLMTIVMSVGLEATGVYIRPSVCGIISVVCISLEIASYFGKFPLPRSSLMLNFGAIANMEFPEIDGREAMGGYTSIAYLAFVADIETFPTEPNIETATDVGDVVKLSGNYAMKTDKYFFEVKVPPQSSKSAPSSQGELGGKSFKNSGEFFIPGLDEQSMGLGRMLNNRWGILIFEDPDGKHRTSFGSKTMPVTFTPKGDSGQKGTDKKGMTFAWECDSFAPGWIYEGTIPLSGSTVPGIS